MAGVVAVVAVAVLVQPGAGSVVDALVATRLSGDSPERADLRRVTAEQFRSAPLVGVGPGRLDLVYVDYLGRLVVAEYTHDEFLQTAAETGLVGAGLAVAVVRLPRRGRLPATTHGGRPVARRRCSPPSLCTARSTSSGTSRYCRSSSSSRWCPFSISPSQHPAEQQREEEVTR